MLAIDVLYYTAQECAREAQKNGRPPYAAAFEIIATIVINNNLDISHDEMTQLANEAVKGLKIPNETLKTSASII